MAFQGMRARILMGSAYHTLPCNQPETTTWGVSLFLIGKPGQKNSASKPSKASNVEENQAPNF
jgi:hypothetical protein